MTDFSLVKDSKGYSLSIVFDDGDIAILPESHASFSEARDYVLSGEELDEDRLRGMVDVLGSVGYNLIALSERVRISGNTLTFDGDPIDSRLSRHIVALYQEGDGEGYKAFVNFLEKLQTNPNEASRESLFTWLDRLDLTIDSSGDFIAYKGVYGSDTGDYLSIHAGTAIVDGVTVKGQIPNRLGAVIEMPRSQVQHDTSIGCSTGLHAGTWEYASDFGRGAVLTVLINPRDVVSVPDDCEFQKLRVSRYRVLDVTDRPMMTHTHYSVSEEETVEDVLEEFEIATEDAPYVDRIVEYADGDAEALGEALTDYFNTLEYNGTRDIAELRAKEYIDRYNDPWEDEEDDEYDEDSPETPEEEYDALIEDGWSEAEARAAVWPDEEQFSSPNGESADLPTFEAYRGKHAAGDA